MSLLYVDTSAAMKLLVEEPESADVAAHLSDPSRRLVASWLLHTELRCAAGRHPQLISAHNVNAVLDAITLVDISRGDLLAAGTHAPLRSHHAIHLASALRVGADAIVTYDDELAEASRNAGLALHAPAQGVRRASRHR